MFYRMYHMSLNFLFIPYLVPTFIPITFIKPGLVYCSFRFSVYCVMLPHCHTKSDHYLQNREETSVKLSNMTPHNR